MESTPVLRKMFIQIDKILKDSTAVLLVICTKSIQHELLYGTICYVGTPCFYYKLPDRNHYKAV